MARRKSKKKKTKSKGPGQTSKPLPFEVSQQSGSNAGTQSAGPKEADSKPKSATVNTTVDVSATADAGGSDTPPSNYIPPEVSKRMVRRASWMAGVPTTLGMSAFFINYYLLVNHIVELPSWLTYAETLMLFGMGFVGLSYGVLSASWEPERDGGLIGLSEFRFNVKVLFEQWREHGKAKRQQQAKD